MPKGEQCKTQECWEAKLHPTWHGVVGPHNTSDALARCFFVALVLVFAISKNQLPDKSASKNNAFWPVCGLFCVLILVFGNFFSAVFVVYALFAQQAATAAVGAKAFPFPKFVLSWDVCNVAVITALALYLRCFDLSTPKYLIFDEVHFGKFMNGHITGEFYFDIHPPMVKLLMSWFVMYFTPWYKGEQPFRDIGEEYLPDSPVKAMRFIPALSSTLIVPTTYLTGRSLGVTPLGSLLAASLPLFDNLHVTEGRVLTTDTTLVFFLAISLLFHVRTEKSVIFSPAWYFNVTITGLCLGFTLSTKWISLNILGVVGICTAIDILQRIVRNKYPDRIVDLSVDFFVRLTLLLVVPLIIYVINFYLWIETTPKWGEFGPAHMPVAFQAHLEGSPVKSSEPAPSFWSTFVHFNTAMFTGNRDVGKGQKGHPWESWWYQWPLNLRGLACWSSGAKFNAALGNSFEEHIYFLGNPFVWWFALLTLFIAPVALLSPRKLAFPVPNLWWTTFMLLLGYFSGLLPYISVRRSCFIYHYMPPMHFLVVFVGVVWDQLCFRYVSNQRLGLLFFGVVVGAFAWAFWYFAPFCYGTPITKAQHEARIWREGWR